MVKHLNLYQKHNKMSHLSDQGQDVWHRRHYVPLPFHHHGCCQNNTQREGGHCGQGNTLHLPPPHQRPHWRWSRSKTLDRGHRAYCAVINAPFWRDVKWSACSGAALYCYWCISCFATCTRHTFCLKNTWICAAALYLKTNVPDDKQQSAVLVPTFKEADRIRTNPTSRKWKHPHRPGIISHC